MNKKVYEEPVVTKVEFDAKDRITASECIHDAAPGNVEFMGCHS